MEFKDKVVIITGAGRGIGLAIALKFAEQQAKVVMADRNEDRAREASSQVEKAGGETLVLGTDVTSYSEVQEMADRTLDRFGKVDILVNNAGWAIQKPFFENPIEVWDDLIDVNLKGCIYCCRAVGEHMIKRSEGRIVNIVSDAGRMGSPHESVYAIAKGGVINLNKSMAKVFAPYKINVNAVSPGMVATPLVTQGIEMSGKIAEEMRRRKEAVPFKRWGEPEEIADAVLFFSSDASRYITGQVLSVNGGVLMLD